MKFEVNVVSNKTIDLSPEECTNILIKTIESDWYEMFEEMTDKDDADAIKRVYYIYSGKTLV
jgi:hypothetical protein